MLETSSGKVPVVIVAAMGRTTRGIGKDNNILWHVPEDLKRFKEMTLGHPVIMGRKTFESILNILGKPLPERTNIVVTHDINYTHEGVMVAHSLDDAIGMALSTVNPREIHIGGGAQLYAQALPFVDRIHLTLFDDDQEADTYFPPFEEEFTKVRESEKMSHNGVTYQWVDYERKK